MATINYAHKEISCKIVYYGPGLGGKTTNLQYIHQILPGENRGELVSLATQQDRTLFFDFLPMDLGEIKGFNIKIHLYTVPGQVYYNATRKLVLRGVDGVVFVADSQRDRMDENINSLENLKDNLKEYSYNLDDIPWVIQYNKRDLDNIFPLQDMETLLNKKRMPSFESVAVTGKGVKATLKAISSMILEKLKTITEEAPVEAVSLTAETSGKATETLVSSKSLPEIPPKPSSSQMPAKEEMGETPYLFSRGNPIEKILPVEQRCSLYWWGIQIGSGELKLVDILAANSRIKYRLKGVLKILAFFRVSLDRRLIYRGKRIKSMMGEQKQFFYLTDPPEGRAPLSEPFSVWINEMGSKVFYLSFNTKFGKVRVMPFGEKPISMED
jgi:hypothetical protein